MTIPLRLFNFIRKFARKKETREINLAYDKLQQKTEMSEVNICICLAFDCIRAFLSELRVFHIFDHGDATHLFQGTSQLSQTNWYIHHIPGCQSFHPSSWKQNPEKKRMQICHLPQMLEKAEKRSNELLRFRTPPEHRYQWLAFSSALHWPRRLKASIMVLQEKGDPIQKETGHTWHHDVLD